MDLRIFIEPQQGATYDDLLRGAKAAEELGFAGSSAPTTTCMGVDGLPGPTDAWATLAAWRVRPARIRLGTLVIVGTFRLPGPRSRSRSRRSTRCPVVGSS